jgi:hypothetical protein
MSEPESGKFYWVKIINVGEWEPAECVDTDYGQGWLLTGVEVEYYANEIGEIGPEIVPPAD